MFHCAAADDDMNINRDYIRPAWTDLHKSSAHAAISDGNLLFADIAACRQCESVHGAAVRRERSEEAGMGWSVPVLMIHTRRRHITTDVVNNYLSVIVRLQSSQLYAYLHT